MLMPDQTNELRALYDKYNKAVSRHEASAQRALARAEKARTARDGIRVAMELEGVWEESVSESAPPPAAPSSSTPGLTPKIREMLPVLPSPITTAVVVEAIRAHDASLLPPGKESSVSSALNRLKDSGQLELIQESAGRRPAEYQYVKPENVSQDSDEGGDDDT